MRNFTTLTGLVFLSAPKLLAIMALFLTSLCLPTEAAPIVWDWAFGTEAGTFTTDGTLDSGGLAPAGTYNIQDFEVTQSQAPILGSMSGGQYNEGSQPGQGFVWNGSQDTQWFRNGGGLTNGTNLYFGANDYRYVFAPGFYRLTDEPASTVLVQESQISLSVVAAAPVPEPSAMLSLLGLILLTQKLTCHIRRRSQRDRPM